MRQDFLMHFLTLFNRMTIKIYKKERNLIMKKLIRTTLASLLLAGALASCDIQKPESNENPKSDVESSLENDSETNDLNEHESNTDSNSDNNTSQDTDDADITKQSFASYNGIIQLYKTLPEICFEYDDFNKIVEEYADDFNFQNETEYTWLSSLLKSTRSLHPENSCISRGYSIGDINGDGVDELILLHEDYTLVAIFSLSNEKPVLLQNFLWLDRVGVIDTEGMIHTYDHGVSSGVYKISENCNTLELIAKIKSEHNENDDTWSYYEYLNGEKVSISRDQYYDYVLYSPLFKPQHYFSTQKNPGINFTSYNELDNIYLDVVDVYKDLVEKKMFDKKAFESATCPGEFDVELWSSLYETAKKHASATSSYSIEDLNNDGIEELIFLDSNKTYEEQSNRAHAIYTYENGAVKPVTNLTIPTLYKFSFYDYQRYWNTVNSYHDCDLCVHPEIYPDHFALHANNVFGAFDYAEGQEVFYIKPWDQYFKIPISDERIIDLQKCASLIPDDFGILNSGIFFITRSGEEDIDIYKFSQDGNCTQISNISLPDKVVAHDMYCNFIDKNNGFLFVFHEYEEVLHATGTEAMLLYKTDDGGKTWTPQQCDKELFLSLRESAVFAKFINEEVGFVSGTYGFSDFIEGRSYVTIDGGKTWQTINSLPYPKYCSSAMIVDIGYYTLEETDRVIYIMYTKISHTIYENGEETLRTCIFESDDMISWELANGK